MVTFAPNHINLKFESFIANRITGKDKSSFSAPILKLTSTAIILGLVVMILSISIVRGFQDEIRKKVAGFEAPIRITSFDINNSYELRPIYRDAEIEKYLSNNKLVKSHQVFAQKAGIIKSKSNIDGVMLKGIDLNYDKSFFAKSMKRGNFPDFKTRKISNGILISEKLANRLQVDTGSKILVYFIQENPKLRSFIVEGIYDSGFEDFDNKFIIGDLRVIQKLNSWDSNQVAGYEVSTLDFNNIQKLTIDISQNIDYNLKAESIYERYPMIMDWLNLLDSNMFFLIILMLVISGITIISTLLIIILERTSFIGLLKSMGTSNKSLRKIFIIQSFHVLFKGLLFGNIIGIGIVAIQFNFKLIPLDPAIYYMDFVPVKIEIVPILLVNTGTILISFLMMLWPVRIISRISPSKSIRFE